MIIHNSARCWEDRASAHLIRFVPHIVQHCRHQVGDPVQEVTVGEAAITRTDTVWGDMFSIPTSRSSNSSEIHKHTRTA